MLIQDFIWKEFKEDDTIDDVLIATDEMKIQR